MRFEGLSQPSNALLNSDLLRECLAQSLSSLSSLPSFILFYYLTIHKHGVPASTRDISILHLQSRVTAMFTSPTARPAPRTGACVAKPSSRALDFSARHFCIGFPETQGRLKTNSNKSTCRCMLHAAPQYYIRS